VAPPLYVAVTTAIHKDTGIQALTNAIEAVKKEISKSKGEITVKVAVSQLRKLSSEIL
jgi:translation initiation factor 2 alpha subunit (eIF-2alpha)